MKFSGNFLHTSANDFESISCKFLKMTKVTANYLWFQIATPRKYHNQTVFVLRGFLFTLQQQKNMFFHRLALSITCAYTPRLSAGDCLQDAGRLEPGILHIRVAAHFGFHRDTVINLWQHFHESFTACDCLRSYRQHVMSNGFGVYTRVPHLCNCFQIAFTISWSIPGLCAVSAKTGHNHLRVAHHLPLPTLCVGLYPWCRRITTEHS